MAVSRLKNTEKRLLRQRATGEVYKTIIGAYQEKGYIRKVENRPKEREPGTSHIFRYAAQISLQRKQ